MQKKTFIIVIIVVLIVAFFKYENLYNLVLEKVYPIKYNEYIEKYSKEYNVDKLLICSIMKAESNFKQDAVSKSGAKGLMQIMDATANETLEKNNNKDIETKSLLDPEKNIMIGTKYYSDLLSDYNQNMLLALAAYNAGIGNVNDWIDKGIIKSDGSNIENIPFKETNMYVRKIVNNYKMYQKLYKNS